MMLVVKSGLGVEDNTAHKIPAAEVQPERKESPKHRKKGEGWAISGNKCQDRGNGAGKVPSRGGYI